MPEAKVTTTVRIDPKVADHLSRVAKRRGLSFTKMAEIALADFVERDKKAA